MSRRVLFFLSMSLVLFLMISVNACTRGGDDTPAEDPEVTSTMPDPEPEPEPEIDESAMTEEPVEEVELKIPVLEDVFFAYDSSNLSGDAKRKLQQNANQIKDASEVDITIEGHCDERGTIAYNLALGERRAKAAKDYLVSLGVSASRVKIISYGKERPFDSGHTESAWAKNRRAHFVVDQR